MKVFIAGATGVLGRSLIQQFRERGHSVIGMARSAKNEDTIRKFGGESRRADLFDADSLARAAEGADVLVHAATAIPTQHEAPAGRLENQRSHPARWHSSARASCRESGRKTVSGAEHHLGGAPGKSIGVRRGFTAAHGFHHALNGGDGNNRARHSQQRRIQGGDFALRMVSRS